MTAEPKELAAVAFFFLAVAYLWWRVVRDEPLVEKCARLERERDAAIAVARNLGAVCALYAEQDVLDGPDKRALRTAYTRQMTAHGLGTYTRTSRAA